MFVSNTFIFCFVDLQFVDECLVGSVESELEKIHHHQVWIVAWVSLAGRTTQLAPRRLDVVGTEGPEIFRCLFLHHTDTLLGTELEELIVQLPHVIMEGDMSGTKG